VHVGNEQCENQSSPEVEETLQAVYASSPSRSLREDAEHDRDYQYDAASSSQDSLWGKKLYYINTSVLSGFLPLRK